MDLPTFYRALERARRAVSGGGERGGERDQKPLARVQMNGTRRAETAVKGLAELFAETFAATAD